MSSAESTRLEAIEAMLALYVYPLAYILQQRWHFADDSYSRLDRAWDEVQHAYKIILDALSNLGHENGYDPERGHVCQFLIWPRIGWHYTDLERARFGRKESDRLATLRRNKEPIPRWPLEPFVDAHGHDAKVLERNGLILQDELHSWEVRPWEDLARENIFSAGDKELLSLRYEEDLRDDDIAEKTGRSRDAIAKHLSRARRSCESYLIRFFMASVLHFLESYEPVDFQYQPSLIEDGIRRISRAIADNDGTISQVLPNLCVGPAPLYGRPVPSGIAGLSGKVLQLKVHYVAEPDLSQSKRHGVLKKLDDWEVSAFLLGGSDASWLYDELNNRMTQAESRGKPTSRWPFQGRSPRGELVFESDSPSGSYAQWYTGWLCPEHRHKGLSRNASKYDGFCEQCRESEKLANRADETPPQRNQRHWRLLRQMLSDEWIGHRIRRTP